MIRRVFFLPAKQQEFLAFSFAALAFFVTFFCQEKKVKDKRNTAVSSILKASSSIQNINKASLNSNKTIKLQDPIL